MAGSTERIGWMGTGLALASLVLAGAALAVAESEPDEASGSEMAAETSDGKVADEASARPVASLAGRVERSAFTTAVLEREPRDDVSELSNDQQELAYFTELHGLEGHTVVHRWEYGDQVMAEVSFEVGGPRWRIHSTKRLDPSWVGTWHVSVLADGEVLTRDEFEYTPASSATASDAPAASSEAASGAPETSSEAASGAPETSSEAASGAPETSSEAEAASPASPAPE